MVKTSIVIDGREVSAQSGATILEAAATVGIQIPTLCHQKELSPVGSCRVCVVEVEGSPRLVGACHTPVEAGMVIRTDTARVARARRTTIQLLLSGHTGPCVTDRGVADCELHQLADLAEAGPPPFSVRGPRFYPVERTGPYVQRDMSRCILCRRCVRACRELAGRNFFAMAYRGSESKVVVDCDQPLDKPECEGCGICIDLCPTTALTLPEGASQADPSSIRPSPGAEPGRERSGLLNRLKAEQSAQGWLSPDFMAAAADELGIGLAEVYGTATFYSFLSTRPAGRHVIRVCKSLPCYVNHAPTIVEGVFEAIGIHPGETTADGRFGFTLTNCIGLCDQAPAMLVDDDRYGNLTPDLIGRILSSYD